SPGSPRAVGAGGVHPAAQARLRGAAGRLAARSLAAVRRRRAVRRRSLSVGAVRPRSRPGVLERSPSRRKPQVGNLDPSGASTLGARACPTFRRAMNSATPILFTIPNFDTAGSGGALWNVVSRLDRRRFAPAICVLRPGGDLASEIERSDVPLFSARFMVPARPLATLAFRLRRAAGAFRGRHFALWHSFHYV